MPPMLVVSRRPYQKLLFPDLNIAVQVVRVNGNSVRLGIEAPPEITILREELQDFHAESRQVILPAESAESRFRQLRHQLRNRLNAAAIGLALLRKQATAGPGTDLERTISLLEQEMDKLRQQIEGEPVKTAAPSSPPRNKARRALLVEDDQNERELLAGFLRASGFTVDTAGDGCDALDQLRRKERPDVVLLDMGLPRFDGASTAREIRRDPACAALKIFAVTGHSPQEYNFDQQASAIDRWFSKPIDPIILLRELTHEFASA